MRGVVIDASVLGKDSKLMADAHVFYAPELIDLEFASLLRKQVIRRTRSIDEADRLIASWAENDVQRFPHAPRLLTIWAMRHNITAYDAAYVALAMELGVPLLTADRKLAAAAASYCEVIVVE